MHKFQKNSGSIQDSSLKPYCFPDMPVGTVANKKTESGKNVFRPIDFDESGKMLDPQKYAGNTGLYEELTPDVNEIEKKAYNEGFEKGEKDGLQSVEERLEPVFRSLSESIVELEQAKKELVMRTEREAVELALAIAEKVVWHEVRINREVVLNVVKAALKKVVDRENIKIRLAPSDLQFLTDAKKKIPGLEENFKKVTFEEDKSILNGGCVIETNLGDVDARIESQLKAVEEAFKSEIKKLRLGG